MFSSFFFLFVTTKLLIFFLEVKYCNSFHEQFGKRFIRFPFLASLFGDFYFEVN